MTYEQWLKTARNQLKASGSPSAKLDSMLLLEKVTAETRTSILANPGYTISTSNLETLANLLGRRLHGEPIAYILGKKEFYGREFVVNKDVLIPRPDSEDIIEMLLEYVKHHDAGSYNIADVGAGTGCLSITAKIELKNIKPSLKTKITAIDISKKALNTAKQNSKIHGADIIFVQSDLLAAVNDKFDIVIVNLPYVPINYDVSNDVKHEPGIALYAGNDGLAIINEFFEQIDTKINHHCILLMESLASQHQKVEQLAKNKNFKLIQTKNLIQMFKYNG